MAKSSTNTQTAASDEPSRDPKKLDWQMKYLPLMALALSAISLSCALFYGIRIQNDLSQIDNLVIEQMGKELEEQQQQQQQLEEKLQNYQQDIQTQLDKYQQGEGEHPNAQIKQLLTILIAQQNDYRGFLRITHQSMIEVSQMVRGSREWTNNYINQMGTVKQRSLEHSKKLDTLRSKLLQKP